MFWVFMNSVRKLPNTISVYAVEFILSTRHEAVPDFTELNISCIEVIDPFPIETDFFDGKNLL